MDPILKVMFFGMNFSNLISCIAYLCMSNLLFSTILDTWDCIQIYLFTVIFIIFAKYFQYLMLLRISKAIFKGFFFRFFCFLFLFFGFVFVFVQTLTHRGFFCKKTRTVTCNTKQKQTKKKVRFGI